MTFGGCSEMLEIQLWILAHHCFQLRKLLLGNFSTMLQCGPVQRIISPKTQFPCSQIPTRTVLLSYGHRHTQLRRPRWALGSVSEREDDILSPETIVISQQSSQPPIATDISVWKWEESKDAVYAYGSLLAILGLGLTPGIANFSLSPLFYFVGLATLTIYIGAHRSLGAKERQQLTIKEGVLAPVFASVVLFGGYLLIKAFPNLSLQAFINVYFGILGTAAVSGAAAPFLEKLPFSSAYQIKIPAWLAEGKDGEQVEAPWTSLLAVALGLIVVTADIMCGHQNFTLNNILACLIATDILQLLGIRTSKTAVILLMGMLFYDVFWVFGSPSVVGDNVMETVATSNLLEGPFKLLFPRLDIGMNGGGSYPFALLGLGDVALPGLLLCLALRYDASRSIDMRARAVSAADAMEDAIANLKPDASAEEIMDATQSAAFKAYDDVADKQLSQGSPLAGEEEASEPMISDAVLSSRTFFMPTLAAYVAGLFTAFIANSVTHLGQPALLYLVPFTVGTVCWKAVSRNELGRVWNFEDKASKSILKASE